MKSRHLLATLAATALFTALFAQTPAPAASPAASAKPKAASSGGTSPHETTSVIIGDRKTGNRVTITYGRPYSIKPGTTEVRRIWGGLVKWDKADRLGSDEATLLLTQQPLQIGETVIPPGAHTLYLVPSETGASKLAFSTNLGKWGVPVDETKDLARVDLVKSTLDHSVDQLTIMVENDKATGGGVIKIQWETTQFALPFAVKK